MRRVEEVLDEKRTETEMQEVPEDFDIRIERVLSKAKPVKRTLNGWRAAVVAAAVLIVFAGCNYDVLAYYGRKLLGFDGIMNGTLARLNDLGRGQEIGSSCTFKNGYIFTLDGVMVDDNQLIAFYTLKSPGGLIDDSVMLPAMSICGKFGRYFGKEGTGDLSGDKTELKGIQHFDAINILEKDLTMEVGLTDSEKPESGKIEFKLDRNKAMGHVLKKDINKKIKVNKDSIVFKSILVTPTKTEIEGSIKTIYELIGDRLKGERVTPKSVNAELIVDGRVVEHQTSGMRTDNNGTTFSIGFDALPNNLKKLQIKLVSFSADHEVKKQIGIDKGKIEKRDQILGQDICVNDVYEKGGDTYVTITTGESAKLTKVFLNMDDKKVELNDTVPGEYEKETDGTVKYKRTLHFSGTGKKLVMDISSISYDEPVNSIIDIPVE